MREPQVISKRDQMMLKFFITFYGDKGRYFIWTDARNLQIIYKNPFIRSKSRGKASKNEHCVSQRDVHLG